MKTAILFIICILSQTMYASESSLRSSKIVIIEDYEHGNEAMLNDELASMKKIKSLDPAFDCLFLEVEEDATGPIQKFLGGISYDEAIGPWIKNTENQIGSKFKNLIPDWYLSSAALLGLKIFGADVNWSSELGQKIIPALKILKTSQDAKEIAKQIPLVVEARSEIIATNVMKNLDSQVCQKAIVIIGDGHTDKFPMGVEVTPLQEFFKQKGHRPVKGN